MNITSEYITNGTGGYLLTNTDNQKQAIVRKSGQTWSIKHLENGRIKNGFKSYAEILKAFS